MTADELRSLIRDIPDHPEPGIVYRDITPLLADPGVLHRVVHTMADPWHDIDVVAGIEARGFIFGAPMAEPLGAGFVPVRKPGKLPWRTVSESYQLEYGTERIEMHQDAIGEARNVLLVDDVIATGGTAAATARLIESMGGHVLGSSFLIELSFLEGRKVLDPVPVRTVLSY